MADYLVDTSIWIDFFNDNQSQAGLVLDHLLDNGDVVICNLLKAEILPFLPTRKILEEIRLLFSALPHLEEYPKLWDDIIENQFLIVQRGINGVGIPDMMICCLAIHHDKTLFSKDKHFRLIANHLPLKLFDLDTLP
jgi:predicted nucleic acid-binding protein